MTYLAKWKLSATAFVTIALWFGISFSCHGQSAKALCDQWCIAHPGKCHRVRADAYLGQGRSSDKLCWNIFRGEARCATPREALQSGIAELKAAALDPSVSQDDLREYRVEIAESTMQLGHQFIRDNKVPEGGAFLDDAAAEFKEALASEDQSEQAQNRIHRIIVGLLRCGHPLDALAATSSIDTADQDRLYLKAVAMMQLGERKSAAKIFEQWIRAGCESDFDLIFNDDKGQLLLTSVGLLEGHSVPLCPWRFVPRLRPSRTSSGIQIICQRIIVPPY